jgi:hypothetical protein
MNAKTRTNLWVKIDRSPVDPGYLVALLTDDHPNRGRHTT